MRKSLLKKYKELQNKIKYYKKIKYTETENMEREFPIEVIASTFEKRYLIDEKHSAKFDEVLKDFWCFITNEDVNLSNIERFNSIIQNEILKQHPNLHIYNYPTLFWYINDETRKELIDWYKNKNGETIKIKSLKKGYIKNRIRG